MVRPAAAGAHAPLHARQAARRHPAGAAGAVPAFPVPLASAGRLPTATSAAKARPAWPTCCASSKAMPRRQRPGKKTCSRARVKDYEPAMLDKLCAAGRVVWWRPFDKDSGEPASARPARSAARRSCCASAKPWRTGSRRIARHRRRRRRCPARRARCCEALRAHGASFFADLQRDASLLGTEVEQALAELVAQGLVTCDSFAGLRALVMPADKRDGCAAGGRATSRSTMPAAGR